jgi:predicted HTH transcriptional regulator
VLFLICRHRKDLSFKVLESYPFSYHGAYHYRSGSTKQELKGAPLNNFLLSKVGLSWERQPVAGATLDDIDEEIIKSLVQKASAKQRIPTNAGNTDTLTFLKNLDLVNGAGELLMAALLLFGKRPKKYAPAAYFKIGRFGKSHSDLKFQDVVEGSILDMADRIMEILSAKYLVRPISYKGLQRIEGLEYPESALREAILNAIIHKDIYTEDYLKSFNLNERQTTAVLYIKENGAITNAIYQSINQISKAVATKDLSDLVNRKLILKIGTTGKGTKYILPSKGL